MKLLLTTFASIIGATATFAGTTGAPVMTDGAAMGASNQWLIPLIALVLIALALSKTGGCRAPLFCGDRSVD